jgi:hypothetical protein
MKSLIELRDRRVVGWLTGHHLLSVLTILGPMAPPQWHQERLRPPSRRENGLLVRVELRGLEPLTPTLPGRLVGVRGRPPLSIAAGQRRVWSPGNHCGRP